MARLSSASTESEHYVPAMVPFRWEVAPGRPAVLQSIDPPSLPLPPGKRPKDGFYLPFPRPPALEVPSTSRGRRRRFPGSPFSRQSSRDMGGGFTHVSGHRFASRVARRVVVELQKRRSCLGACLSSPRRKSSSSSHGHQHHPCQGLESIREPPSPASGSSSGSSQHHKRPHINSSVARQHSQLPQSQVLRTSQFMASMLMALCPADGEPDHESDEEAAVDDGESNSTDADNPVAMPRARVSSPERLFQAPHEGLPMKLALQQHADSPSSHEERTRAWVDLSTDMSRCNLSERKDPTQCECCGGQLQQPRMLSWKPRTQYIKTEQDPDSDHAFSARSHVPKSSEHLRTTRPSFASTVWQEALRSSPLWPKPTPITSTDDESGEDSGPCSRASSPAAPPPRGATWGISGELLKSSSLLKHKQELQQDEECTRVGVPCALVSDSSAEPSKVKASRTVMRRVAEFEATGGTVGCSSGESLRVNVTRTR